jgi:hypothetical protein
MRSVILRTTLALGLGMAVAVTGVHATTQTPAAKTTQSKTETKLPAAVQAAFKKAYPDATIKNVNHETEDGQEQYEIESTNHGRGLDVNYKPDGTLLVVEEEITEAEMPAAVNAAIAKRYPKATVTLRERMTEKGALSYEIGLKGAPVKTAQLAPDGTWISPKPGK